MLVQVFQILWESRLWQLASCPDVLVVHIDHTELWLHVHCSREQIYVLVEQIFTAWGSWVIDEDDTICFLLDWSPTLFVLHVS